MHSILRAASVAALVFFLPLSALAQDKENKNSEEDQDDSRDLEFRGSTLDDGQDSNLAVSASFESQWHEYNNVDFRERDETSDQAILDSDDRDSFAFTGIRFDVGYSPDETVRLVVGASHRGLWGSDQIGTINAFGGWMYLTALYVDLKPKGAGENAPTMRIGRQFFQIGGQGGAPDYVLSDILDMVRIDLPFGNLGSLTLIPIDVPSAVSENDQANFVSFIGQGMGQTFGMRGDHMSRRHGGMLVLDKWGLPIEARAYAFYTDVGSTAVNSEEGIYGSGSDISYGGRLGNFSDNDWVLNVGGRATLKAGPLTAWASVDGSVGIDRKELVVRDAKANGSALGGGAALRFGEEDGLRLRASYFQALGPAYDDEGLLFSHGYVGMKGRQVGGTLANRYLGWHPTSYVGFWGVSDRPHASARQAGTRVIHAAGKYELPGPLAIGARWWWMQDTGITYVNINEIDSISPPFGYARAEFAAQERLGKTLGHEVDVDIDIHATERMDFRINGALLLPGEFYAIPIARVAGDQLGGQTMAWTINGGTRVRF